MHYDFASTFFYILFLLLELRERKESCEEDLVRDSNRLQLVTSEIAALKISLNYEVNS